MMTRRPKAKPDAQPTWTSKFMDALRERDDFMTLAQLRAATSANLNQATATVHHLKKRSAISAMESDGQLWFYATPEADNRGRCPELRVPEEPGNRHRRRRAAPATG